MKQRLMKQSSLFEERKSCDPSQWITASGIAAPITLHRQFLNAQQQDALLIEARTYPFARPQIKVFDKQFSIPRQQVWFGDEGCDYQYSGLMVTAQPWPHYAQKLRDKLRAQFDVSSNGVLVNHYRDGYDHVGWHSDNEQEIVEQSIIASVSVGAPRDFIIRHNQSQEKISIELRSGDLLLMHWPMQQQWQHCLPKRLKVSEARINYTLRLLNLNK